MSKRFPDMVVCPDCGLTVAGKASTGVVRAHSQKALDAGFYKSPCVANSKAAQNLEAQERRRNAAEARRAYWKTRDPDGTINDYGTPQHQPRT